jgi:23S rRNA pseudouridine2605 synthase
LTAEQLEASRAERLRQNGHGALTLEDARTWIEETGLCLFLPRRQSTPSVAPSFVEAVAGQRDATPDPKNIAIAEELLVRLELDGVAVRLNLLGQVGEQPDYVVAAWVLPYVYALRGDRDWRRSPQLTGSRQVSQLAVQAYKLLEAADTTVSDLKTTLGREVTEAAVLRAITELWQQLRIIPVIAAPGQAAQWQLLRHRFQKAIAEGASTSQVTAISVLASIFLQAVIAASMEEVELFLAPLTARSKVREVLRGLVATRQVHTISLGHSPQFYVAGTLPEFAVAPTAYTSSSMPASAYFLRNHDEDMPEPEPVRSAAIRPPAKPHSEPRIESRLEARSESRPEAHVPHKASAESHGPRKPATGGKAAAARPHFSRPASHTRDRKPAQSSGSSRPARHTGSDARSSSSRPTGSRQTSSRPSTTSRPAAGSRPAGARSAGLRTSGAARPANGARPGSGSRPANGAHSNGNGSRTSAGAAASRTSSSRPPTRPVKSAAPAWSQRNGHANGTKPAAKSGAPARNGSAPRKDSRVTATRPAARTAARPTARPSSRTNARPSSRTEARPARSSSSTGSASRRTPVAASTAAKTSSSKRFGFAARPKQGTKKRG